MPSDASSVLNHIIAILDCFSVEQPSLGVREAARMANMTPSTAGRLMAEMKEVGILQQNPISRLYSMGSKTLTWAGVFTASLDLRSVAMPYMEELLQTTSETVTLYTLEGNERLCVERLESHHNIRMVSRVGMRLPLYAGSAGKAILAFLPVEKREEILQNSSMKPFTRHTYSDKDQLRNELEKIRIQGYSVSHGEWLVDASGVATPCFGQGEAVIGALTISGPTSRFTEEKVKAYAVEVVKAAVIISQLMGSRTVNTVLNH
jgi:DNA-binding IclR family transcriptional regulator